MAEIRTDPLIVRPGSSRSAGPAPYVALLRCTQGTLHVYTPLCLCANAERELFLMPDAFGNNCEASAS